MQCFIGRIGGGWSSRFFGRVWRLNNSLQIQNQLQKGILTLDQRINIILICFSQYYLIQLWGTVRLALEELFSDGCIRSWYTWSIIFQNRGVHSQSCSVSHETLYSMGALCLERWMLDVNTIWFTVFLISSICKCQTIFKKNYLHFDSMIEYRVYITCSGFLNFSWSLTFKAKFCASFSKKRKNLRSGWEMLGNNSTTFSQILENLQMFH